MTHCTDQKGFTLVELAISIVVIGLIIGGILKGGELLDNSQVNTGIRQIKAYESATQMFRETHGALPGDITDPQRLPNCTVAPCATPGNGNDRVVDSMSGDSNVEGFNYFPHLSKAGFIANPKGGTETQMAQPAYLNLFFPRMPWKATIAGNQPYVDIAYYQYAAFMDVGVPWMPTHVYRVVNSRVKFTAMMDQKMDDGLPLSGNVRHLSSGMGCTVVRSGVTVYAVGDHLDCVAYIKADF